MKKIFLSLLLLPLLISCSDNPASFQTEEVVATVKATSLKVQNKIDVPLYHFVIEQESVARVFWFPQSTDENKIEPMNNLQIPLGEILGYEKGKNIILYYWTSEEPTSDDIQSMVIKTK